MKVAVVTSEVAASLSDDDSILIPALEKRGCEVFHWTWTDANVDWSELNAALIRTPWDYFHDIDAFRSWLKRAHSSTKLINPYELVSWNLDKRYLEELATSGVPIVPTHFVERAAIEDAVLEVWAKGASAVVKPTISGGAFGLVHLQPRDEIEVAHSGPHYLVQPMVPSLVEDGELSVIMLGGELSHSIRKWPGENDIRVQREHGGRYALEEAGSEALELASVVLGLCPCTPVYARVDMVMHQGSWVLMELEVIEPELFFAYEPKAADRLAQLVA